MKPDHTYFTMTGPEFGGMFNAMNGLRIRRYVLLMLSAAVLQACTSTNASIPPGLVESLDAGVLAGDLGDPLDKKARKLAVEAEYKALEAGQTGMPVPWKLTDNIYGNVVPQQPYSVGSVNCRRYVHTINSKGEIRSATGTACRNDDGVWQPLS